MVNSSLRGKHWSEDQIIAVNAAEYKLEKLASQATFSPATGMTRICFLKKMSRLFESGDMRGINSYAIPENGAFDRYFAVSIP
jgi:hypothetical protein